MKHFQSVENLNELWQAHCYVFICELTENYPKKKVEWNVQNDAISTEWYFWLLNW